MMVEAEFIVSVTLTPYLGVIGKCASRGGSLLMAQLLCTALFPQLAFVSSMGHVLVFINSLHLYWSSPVC